MSRAPGRWVARTRGRRRGGAAIAVVIALVLVQLGVVGVVVATAREQTVAARRLETVRAFYAAEAGVNMALRELGTGTDEDADGVVGSISNDDDDATDPVLGTARVRVTLEDDGGVTLLRAGGASGRASRNVEVALASGSVAGSLGGGGSGSTPGLEVEWHAESGSLGTVADVAWDDPPDQITATPTVNWPSTNNAWPGWSVRDRFGVQVSGWIDLPADGMWEFRLSSDDGSRLWIGGVQVVNNDGRHSMRARTGSADLGAGRHAIRVRFFENGGRAGLVLEWRGPTVPSFEIVPETALWH